MNRKQIKALKALQNISQQCTFYLQDWRKNKSQNKKKKNQQTTYENLWQKKKRSKSITNLQYFQNKKDRVINDKRFLKKSYENIVNDDQISIQEKERELIFKEDQYQHNPISKSPFHQQNKQQDQRFYKYQNFQCIQKCKQYQHYSLINNQNSQNKHLVPIRKMSLSLSKSSKALRYAQKVDLMISKEPIKVQQSKIQQFKKIKRLRFLQKLQKSQRISLPNLHSVNQSQVTKVLINSPQINQIKKIENILLHPKQNKYQKFRQKILNKFKKNVILIQDPQKQPNNFDMQLKKQEVTHQIELMKNWLQGKKAGRKSLNVLLKEHFQLQCKLRKKSKIKSLQKKLVRLNN